MVFFSRFKVCTYLINPVFSCSRNVQVTYVDKTSQLNTIVFRNYNYWFLIHTWSDKACKAGYRAYAGYRCVPGICRVPLCTGHMPGTVVYRAYAGYRCVPGIYRVLLCTGQMPGTVVYKAYAGYRCGPGICRVPLCTGHMPFLHGRSLKLHFKCQINYYFKKFRICFINPITFGEGAGGGGFTPYCFFWIT